MAEEPKTADAGQDTGKNAAAEQDVQNVLAELKGESAENAQEQKAEPTNGTEPATEKDAETKEEERVVAAAAKLGEKAAADEEKSRSKPEQGHRGQKHGDGPARRGWVKPFKSGRKSDLTSGEKSSDPNEIRKQVEFYFSDSNLPMDKFLLSHVGGSENRPVEISVLHSFKRMRRFEPFSAIVDALKDSNTLEVTDNDTRVRRKVPLPENVNDKFDPDVVKVFEDQAMLRSIYAKGFGQEKPSTQFDIEAFFTPYGPLNAVRLRRTREGSFKGSVFVEFDSEETQKKFLELDPKPKWNGTEELLIKSKKDYCEDKVEDIKAGRIKAKGQYTSNRGRGGRGRDERDWRDRRAEDQKRGFKPRRGGGNGHRGGRNDRSEDKQTQKESPTSAAEAKGKASTAASGQKRAREDEASDENGKADVETERPAKKVDVGEG